MVAAFLAACAAETPQTFAVARQSAVRSMLNVPPPALPKLGIYVSGYGGSNDTEPFIAGFAERNRQNRAPICSESIPNVDDIAADEKGDLIVPALAKGVEIFAGPDMCGPELGWIDETVGDAIDAASIDAANGPIVVAVNDDGSGSGSLLVCTLKNGCATNLQNPGMHQVISVALAKNRDCWASSDPVALTYFRGCSGSGQTATGYENPYPGGLDIDKDGNLVSISNQVINQDGKTVPLSVPTYAVYVYSGCRPACKRVGGPFTLEGQASYGHLNGNSTAFAVADYRLGQIDVYKYSPKALTYDYSFNNGLFESSIKGVAYNRRSVEQEQSQQREGRRAPGQHPVQRAARSAPSPAPPSIQTSFSSSSTSRMPFTKSSRRD